MRLRLFRRWRRGELPLEFLFDILQSRLGISIIWFELEYFAEVIGGLGIILHQPIREPALAVCFRILRLRLNDFR